MKKLIRKLHEVISTFKYIHQIGEIVFKMNSQVKLLDDSQNAYIQKVLGLETSLISRKIEIGEILEQLQNLDNNEVIMNLHNRIKELENGRN